MATLYVRDVPDDVYELLRRRAAERQTSISAEAIRLLRRSLGADRQAVRRFLDQVETHPLRVPCGTSSPAELIREDRDAG
jgi:plasmid stability protein